MFSIIIPLYNKQKTIKNSLESVLEQTFTNFEIIVVNDGSTDKSVDIVKNMSDKRISTYSKANGGVSSARNYGIEKATNPYIAFLDADDLWLPDYLESIKGLIDKYPGCGMYATGRYEDLHGLRTVIKSKYHQDLNFVIDDYCKEAHIMQMSSLCIEKSVVLKIGLFPVNVKIGEDVDFKLRVASYFKIAYLNLPKTVYSVGTENNSFSFKCHFSDMFPYWKWYFYPYNRKISLFWYTTKKIIEAFKRVYFSHLFSIRAPKNNADEDTK